MDHSQRKSAHTIRKARAPKSSVCREAQINTAKLLFTGEIIHTAQTQDDMLVVSCTSFACIVSNDARVTPYVACANHTPHHGEEYTYGGGECTLEGWK